MRKKLLFSMALGLLCFAHLYAEKMVRNGSSGPLLVGFADVVEDTKQNTVTGTVSDNNGPLAGVTVSVVGGTAATQTDEKGAFSIEAPIGSTLRFSSLAYNEKEVVVQSSTISVVLEANDQSLDEVVVVGYGTQRRGNLTGAVSTINVKENLEGRPIADVGRGIQGTTPGLTITIPSGEVGSDPTIKIRGAIASVQGEGNPLILLDNVEIPSIQYVNPDDVESITVLKDAASASIYGAKAAFGVILITTKTGGGATEKVTVNYSNNFSFQNPFKKFEMGRLNALKYTRDAMLRAGTNITGAFYYLTPDSYEKAREWEEQYGGTIGPDDPTVYGRDWIVDPTNSARKLGLRTYDPYDYMIREWAPTITNNASLNGTFGRTRYTASFAQIAQSGMLKPGDSDKFKRLNGSLRVTSDLNDYVTVRGGAMFSQRNKMYPYATNSTTADAWYYMYRWGPLYPMGDDERGNPIRSPFSEFGSANEASMKRNYINMNIGTTVKLKSNWRVDVDYNFTNEDYSWFRPGTRFSAADSWSGPAARLDANGNPVYVDASGAIVDAGSAGAMPAYDLVYREYTSKGANPDHVYARSANAYKHTLNAFTTYDLNISGGHDFKFMLGTNLVTDNGRMNYTQQTALLDIYNPQFNLATGTITGGGETTWGAQLGYFGRINYAYKNRYLLETNLRYDGSSSFPSDLKWRWFPSFSAGWVASEENFMEWSRPYLSHLKLRGSWGRIGNQAVPADLYVSNMESSQSSWIANGARVISVGTPALRVPTVFWEDLETLDIGVDARFFNNKLGLVFDWYQKTTKNMFSQSEGTTWTLGGPAPWGNFGELQTRGFEVAVDFNHRFENGLGINLRANLDDAKSVFNNFTSSRLIMNGTQPNRYNGYVHGDIWGYETDRLYQYDDFVLDASGNPQIVKLTPEMTKYYTSGNGETYLQKNGPNGEAPVYQARLETTNTFNFGPGDVKFKDLNGDGEIDNGDGTIDNPGDMRIIGNSTPRYNYGFRVGADYSGFDFSMFFQGVGQRAIWGNGPLAIPGFNTADGAMPEAIVSDYWTPETPDAFYPAAFNNANSNEANNMWPQSRYLLDMSYLRIKNITVGYSLPTPVLTRLHVNSLRLYIALENFFTWDKLNGLPIDPEEVPGVSVFDQANTNVNNYNAGRTGVGTPTFKSASFGLQLNF